MFISEKIIDQVVEKLESADFEKEIEKMGKQQPALMSFVFSEDFDLLTQSERDLMLYMLLVIWQSVTDAKGEAIPPVSTKAIEAAEEHNWELLDSSKAQKFRDRMTVFFEDTEQEDLLAFVEDTLTEDDEEGAYNVTKEGREPLFVALKSVIDVIIA
jgi:hypothetical protein